MAEGASLFSLRVDVTFHAVHAEEADHLARDITALILEHEAVWSVTGDFDPEQKTESVDG